MNVCDLVFGCISKRVLKEIYLSSDDIDEPANSYITQLEFYFAMCHRETIIGRCTSWHYR